LVWEFAADLLRDPERLRAGLEETRRTAETKIEHLRGRLEEGRKVGAYRDILLDSYANLIPQRLQELDSEERSQIYAMLRLRIVIDLDGDMEITGVLGAGAMLCNSEPTSACEYQNTKTPGFTFHAGLGGGSPRVRLEPSMAVSSQR
jgi:hypothetical protein